MSLSVLLLLMLLILCILLGLAFYFLSNTNRKAARGCLIVAILLGVGIIFLATFLTFTYNLFYLIVVLLQIYTLLLNIKTLKKTF